MLSENVETLGGGEEGPESVLVSPGDDPDPSQVLFLYCSSGRLVSGK